MAHFAELNQDNQVLRVVVVGNNDCKDQYGQESEEVGIQFCKSLFGQETIWRQTSYNGNIRKNYAAIGYTYDDMRNAFIPPKPYESWRLNEATCLWESPVPMPEQDPENPAVYNWDEQNQEWKKVEISQ